MQQGLRLETGAPAEALAGLAPILAALERQHGRESRWLVETLLMLGRARHGVALADAAAYAGQRARDRPRSSRRGRGRPPRGWPCSAASRRPAPTSSARTRWPRKHELTALQAEVELARARVLWDGDLPHHRDHAGAPIAGRRSRSRSPRPRPLRRLGAREALRQAEDWLRAHPAP
jgi:hypothetical protein